MGWLANSRKGKNKSGTTKGINRKHRMDLFLHYLYVFVLSVVFLAAIGWASVTLYRYIISQVRPSDEIVVGAFTSSVSGFADDKTVRTILSSKLKYLKRLAEHEFSGFGLIRTPVLTSIPEQVRDQSDVRKRLEELKLNVKGIEVNSVMNAIQSVYAPARLTFEGEISETGDHYEIRAELKWKDNTIREWIASRTKTKQIQESLNGLCDDLLFQIIYDIPRDPRLRWLAQKRENDEIPNWQTLKALTLGLKALETYEQSLDYEDLVRAKQHLEKILIYAPGYALGQYYYAIALGENREEESAAPLLEQVERMSMNKMLTWQAKFQRAASMLRRYNRPFAEKAVKEVLKPLIKDLESASNPDNKQSSSQEKNFASRLLPLAYAQLAHTYGTLLTLNSAWTPDELHDFAKQSLDASKKAKDTFDKVGNDWADDRERKEVESWIYNTRGYSKFRIAYFVNRRMALENKESTEDANKKFRAACDEALKDLQKANEILPNTYEVLQNTAMILDDMDYDPAGTHLSEAEALYERTKLFVPRDYYQYERLALIYWRKLKLNPSASIQNALIEKGQKAVSLARDNRFPNKSRTAEVLGAYFSALAAKYETDVNKKYEGLREAITQAELAVMLKAPKDPAHDTAALMKEIANALNDSDPKEKALKDSILKIANNLQAL